MLLVTKLIDVSRAGVMGGIFIFRCIIMLLLLSTWANVGYVENI